jgi:hypothetical protein
LQIKSFSIGVLLLQTAPRFWDTFFILRKQMAVST